MKQHYKKFERTEHLPNENILALHLHDFNEETKAALAEARLISEGKTPSKSFGNVEDLMEDLMSDDQTRRRCSAAHGNCAKTRTGSHSDLFN